MVHSKVLKLVLDGHGSFLGMEKGCFIVKDRNDNVERYPLFEKEIGEVVLKSGNLVSTGALASLGFWDIDGDGFHDDFIFDESIYIFIFNVSAWENTDSASFVESIH